MSNNAFRVKNSLHLTPQAVEPSGLEVGDLWMDIDGNLKRWDGSASQDVGSGGVGSVDIMFAQTLEQAVIGDFTTTGTVAIVEIATNPLDILQGKKTLKITHTGGASAEQIVEVPAKFRNKNVTLSLDVNSDATSGNLSLTVTDQTNTVTLINAESIQPQEAGQTSVKRSVSFNVPSDCEELKYKFTAVSESGAISLIDNVVIELTQTAKLDTTIEVPVITEEVDAGAITIGATTTAPTKGTTSTDKLTWHREGQFLIASYRYAQTSIGNAGNGDYLFSLPAGLEVDTSIIPTYTGAINTNISHRSIIGTGARWDSGPTHGVMFPILYSSNQFRVRTDILYTSVSFMSNSNTHFGLAGVTFTIDIKVPILGWEATETQSVSLAQTVLVQESDSELMAKGNAGQAITANTTDIPFTLVSNQGPDINFTGTTFSVNTDGIYEISVGVFFTAATGRYIALFANGGIVHALTESLSTTLYSGSISLQLAQGVNYSIRSQDGSGTLSNLPFLHYLTVTKHGSLKQLNVSENQKIEIPTSELRMEGASSRGTGSDSAIVRFDNIAKLRGDAFTVESTAALGTVITMKKKGKLDVSATIAVSTINAFIFVSKNQTVRTGLPSIASEIMASKQVYTGAATDTISTTFDVNVGDVIRFGSNTTINSVISNSLNLSFQEQEVAVSVTNVLPQFSESDSSVRVDTANGYGSTNTYVRKFSNALDNIGTAISRNDGTLGDSLVSGDYYIIKENGIYHITYSDSTTASVDSARIAITKNSSQLNTFPTANILAISDDRVNTAAALNRRITTSWSGYLQLGDVIRAQADAPAVNGGESFESFTISKVGKPNVTGVDVTPFAKIEYEVKQHITASNALGYGSTATRIPYYSSVTNTNNGLIQVGNDSINGFSLTALKACELDFNAEAAYSVASNAVISINGSVITNAVSLPSINVVDFTNSTQAGHFAKVSASLKVNVGDVIRLHTDAATISNGIYWRLSATATELRDAYQVIGGGVENTYSARITSAGAITSQSYPFIESISKGGTGTYNITFKAGFFTQAPSVIGTIDTNAGNSAVVITAGITTAGLVANTVNVSDVLVDKPFNLTVTRQGSDYRTPSKAIGLPAQRVAYIKDVKAAGASSGTFTSGAWQTRTLNALTDPTGLVTSLASNQFVLPAGVYDIEASAPAYKVGRHKAKIRNTTDSLDVLIGEGSYTDSTDNTQTTAIISGRISITSSKTFELQHRCQTSAAGNGFGVDSNFVVDEVYAQVKITKIEE